MTGEERKEIVKYRIEKAHLSLKEIDYLMAGAFWNTATNRMYYACYYAVSALLIKHGHRVSSHTGAISLFSQHFIKPGLMSKKNSQIYSELFQKRHAGDYTDFFDNTEDFILGIRPKMEDLILEIPQLIEEE